MIHTARELIQGKPTLVLRTEGLHLTGPTAEDRLTSGWWHLNRKRVKGCTWVLVYVLPEGAAEAKVLIGRYDDIKEAGDNSGTVAVAFIKERDETTKADWATFSDSAPRTRNFRRYLNH